MQSASPGATLPPVPFTIRFSHLLGSLAVPALTVGVAVGATHCASPYALPIAGMDASTTPPPSSSSGGGDDTGTGGGEDAAAQDGGGEGEAGEAGGDGAGPHGDAGDGRLDASGDAKLEGGSAVDCGTCSGCCGSTGTCEVLTSTTVCGSGGSACVDCSQNTCASGSSPCCKVVGGCGCAVLGLVGCN